MLSSIWVRTAALIDVFLSIGRQKFVSVFLVHSILNVHLVFGSFTAFISEKILCPQ